MMSTYLPRTQLTPQAASPRDAAGCPVRYAFTSSYIVALKPGSDQQS